MIRQLARAAVPLCFITVLAAQQAEACGCFAPPDPTVPIVQAGERILFAVNNGTVTAHIQIQYAGAATDFGWLLPLPSVPTLELGTDELFTQLIASTQPRYFVQTKVNGACATPILAPNTASDSAGGFADAGSGSPLVTESSIGPYDYAVLKADSKTEMFNWLINNHYFIPTGTDETVGNYIHPGAYFLALKLKSGKSAGDIQPVVLKYPSDLPMIPIILTSVAAQPNMGIQVWMLGEHRAIPRNYNHVVINDALIDWLGAARNYNDVVLKAISETPDKHAFITEYAGPSDVMVNVLDAPGRFGIRSELAALTSPVDFVEYLFNHGYAASSSSGLGFPSQSLPPLTKSLVLASVPVPPALATRLSEDAWLSQLRYYLGSYRQENPADFEGYNPVFDAPALAAQLNEKVVQPALNAGQLFRGFSKLSRLYTALSPQDMTRDPVFSFNADLPDVSRDHTAVLNIDCHAFTDIAHATRTLVTEQGWRLPQSNTTALDAGPGAWRIETLPEEGAAVTLTDNSALIGDTSVRACGCTAVEPFGVVGLLAVAARMLRRRAR